MQEKETGEIMLDLLGKNEICIKEVNINHILEFSLGETVETSELPDCFADMEQQMENDIEFYLNPPKNHRESKRFVEKFHPSLGWIGWWSSTYGCNNWRKMHGLPMERRMRK